MFTASCLFIYWKFVKITSLYPCFIWESLVFHRSCDANVGNKRWKLTATSLAKKWLKWFYFVHLYLYMRCDKKFRGVSSNSCLPRDITLWTSGLCYMHFCAMHKRLWSAAETLEMLPQTDSNEALSWGGLMAFIYQTGQTVGLQWHPVPLKVRASIKTPHVAQYFIPMLKHVVRKSCLTQVLT